MKARVIAIYLPQYHPTPENNLYWGKGFTEWTNVVKARPLFRGHYQPKLPADLGFYDLRLPEVREQQAQMAKDAGIEGFMYWHYWFGGGKMTLERPFKEVLESGKPDFPFCLGWANHTWSNKTWTKQKTFAHDAVIFEQTYPGEEDYIAHFNYCLSAFKDKRYITVDGKPIFGILLPESIPHVENFISLWRSLAQKAGLPGIHFIGFRMSRMAMTVEELRDKGFDAINNGNYNMWNAECKIKGSKIWKFASSYLSEKLNLPIQKYNYKKIIKWMCDGYDLATDVYPTILPGYDRSPRAGRKAQIYYNNTPELFAKHVDDVLEHVKNKSDEHKIILLKSWNEWGEGNYMEPDDKYGTAFLDVLREKLE
jgi:hypothetical protein